MADTVLNDITNVGQISTINDNFDKVEDHLNNKALNRDEAKPMLSDLDMNGYKIYNLPQPTSDNEPVRLKDIRDIQIDPNTLPTQVLSFNTRVGAVTLTDDDVIDALGFIPAPTVSPSFTGTPTAPTPATVDQSTKIATTEFVKNAIAAGGGGGGTAGVTTFNTRTGAVTLNSDDVVGALTATSATKNLVWTNSGTGSNLYMRREANYTGGNLGFVYGAMYVETYTPTGTHNAFEWGITSVLHSRSVRSSVGGDLGVAPHNVAMNGTVFRSAGNAPVWGGNFVAYHSAGEYTGSQGEMHGVEINVGGNGIDVTESSIGVFVVPQLVSGAAGPGSFEGWTGMWIIGDASRNARFRTGITNQAGRERGYHDRGNHVVAIDLADSNNTDCAIRVKANDWISLDRFSSVKFRYNDTNGRIEFFGNGANRGFIDVVNGANVDLASSGGGGGNFVTVDTTQTITGTKTFSNTIFTNGGLSVNTGIMLNSSSATIQWPSAGNVTSSANAGGVTVPGAAAGFLRILIDGSAYKIPFYNN